MGVALKRTENTVKLLGKLHAHFSRHYTHTFLANHSPKEYRISDVYPSEKPGCKELRSAKSQPLFFGHLNSKRHVVRPREI